MADLVKRYSQLNFVTEDIVRERIKNGECYFQDLINLKTTDPNVDLNRFIAGADFKALLIFSLDRDSTYGLYNDEVLEEVMEEFSVFDIDVNVTKGLVFLTPDVPYLDTTYTIDVNPDMEMWLNFNTLKVASEVVQEETEESRFRKLAQLIPNPSLDFARGGDVFMWEDDRDVREYLAEDRDRGGSAVVYTLNCEGREDSIKEGFSIVNVIGYFIAENRVDMDAVRRGGVNN